MCCVFKRKNSAAAAAAATPSLFQTNRAKARVEKLKANEPEEPEQAAPGEEKGEGGGELLSAEDEKKVLMRVIKKRLKPGGKNGETAARLSKSFVEGGVSLNTTPQLLQSTVFHATGVKLKQYLNITCPRNTVKVLALGITQLDGEELVKAVVRAPFLLIVGDESLRNRDKKFPVFVAFHDVEADAPWFGLLRVCSMKDKTAETQAQLFYETIVDTLGYPKHQGNTTPSVPDNQVEHLECVRSVRPVGVPLMPVAAWRADTHHPNDRTSPSGLRLLSPSFSLSLPRGFKATPTDIIMANKQRGRGRRAVGGGGGASTSSAGDHGDGPTSATNIGEVLASHCVKEWDAPLNNITLAENSRQTSPTAVQEVVESIQSHGWVDSFPRVMFSDLTEGQEMTVELPATLHAVVIDGNHRLAACKEVYGEDRLIRCTC
ncbi:unnamed protein product [Ectocarpus sp. CCAP 1310/34]|nr:unnamed protein product [Ectocarpus sp. CCAP 1310/34]